MNKKIIIPILAIVIILGVVIWQKRQHGAEQSQQEAAAIEQAKTAPSINGMEVQESLAKRRPLAVMIENHPDSRPQSGLTDADIVYEILAEGGISRFLALYQTHDPEELGPVRSTRPYFNFIANQWGALLAHSGGSQAALRELEIGYYRDLADGDEMLNGKYYKRSSTQFPPHNLFTSSEKLRQMLADRKLEDWHMDPAFAFKAIPTNELKPAITEVTIPFSTASYLVKYQFDASTNTYKRFLAGREAKDKNNGLTISPKNIIVQFALGKVIPGDPTLAMEFRLDTSGKIYLFSGGALTQGKWKYQSGKIVYTDNSGNPLSIQPGQTWIEVIPVDQQNNISWK